MIWLASFPRSGNTFLRNVLSQVYGQESSEIHERNLRYYSTHMEYPVVKTHLLPEQVCSKAPLCPVVCLVRDGRDALVSLAHHRTNIIAPGSNYLENLQAAFRARHGSHFGGWHDNVLQWVLKADVIIRFEDLIKDPIGQASRLRSILPLPDAQLEKLPTFETQKFGKTDYGRGLQKNKLFFRKGKVGDWKEEMPEKIQYAFWKKNSNLMGLLGYSLSGTVHSLPDISSIKEAAGVLNRSKRSWFQSWISKVRYTKKTNAEPTPQLILNPEMVYLDTTADPRKFFEKQLIQVYGIQKVVHLRLVEGNKVSITDAKGNSISDAKNALALVVHFPKCGLDALVKLKSKPLYVTWIQHPFRLLLDKFAHSYGRQTTEVAYFTSENEPETINAFVAFLEAGGKKNHMKRVISKFSGDYLDFIGDIEYFEEHLTRLSALAGWPEVLQSRRKPKPFTFKSNNIFLIRKMKKSCRRDLEMYEFYNANMENY